MIICTNLHKIEKAKNPHVLFGIFSLFLNFQKFLPNLKTSTPYTRIVYIGSKIKLGKSIKMYDKELFLLFYYYFSINILD